MFGADAMAAAAATMDLNRFTANFGAVHKNGGVCHHTYRVNKSSQAFQWPPGGGGRTTAAPCFVGTLAIASPAQDFHRLCCAGEHPVRLRSCSCFGGLRASG
jgi:hypothetical protein